MIVTDADINTSCEKLDLIVNPGENFDIVKRTVRTGERRFAVYFIDGLIKDDPVRQMLDALFGCGIPSGAAGISEICERCVPASEIRLCRDYNEAARELLCGKTLLLCDGSEDCAVIDCRRYPQRNVSEPENDKVLRGPRTGFCETMTVNTALIRRHIRDPRLVMKLRTVGDSSRTDVAICYLRGRADEKYAEKLDRMICGIKTDSLTLGAQSLSECLIRRKWYDPFPKIRYTERPDCAAAHLLEGKVLIITDNSPNVMILPAAIFDFIQESDDYYLPPLIGSYFRTVRCLVSFLTMLLSPLWYLLISYPGAVPRWLSFIIPKENTGLPVIVQLFILEFAVDGLKLAALNTPSMLSGSFSIIGGLILGDFAVRVGWFIPDTILYAAFVAVANFSQPSYELGYAFKFLRMLLLALTAIAGVWGFAAGLIIAAALIALNETVGGKSYLYPLIPFDAAAMGRHLVRRKKKK